MQYTEKELVSIQQKECIILKAVHEFCDKNNIEYFIIGGTALGAVRHKGFIPWDDDIDIGMTRENYEKFLNLSPDVLGENLVIADRKNEKNCPFPYAKVRLKNTEFIEYCNDDIKDISKGIYVDVFPFDKIPTDDALYRKQFKKVQKLSKQFVRMKQRKLSQPPEKIREKVKAIIKLVSYYFYKVIPDVFVLDRLMNEMKKYNATDSHEYSCLFFPKMYTEYTDEKTLYPLKEYQFEDLIVYGPNDMDTYLKSHYGDYMKLPPEEERVGHRPYRIRL